MTTITRLKTLTGETLLESWDSTDEDGAVFYAARRVLADWADCEFSEVDYREFEGEFYWTVDDEPVAYLDVERTRTPKVNLQALESAMGSERFAAAMSNPVFARSLKTMQ